MHIPHTGPMTRHDMPSGQHANGCAVPEKLNPAPPVVKFMPAHWPKGFVAHGGGSGSEPADAVASATAATCALPPAEHKPMADGERRKNDCERKEWQTQAANGLSSSSYVIV